MSAGLDVLGGLSIATAINLALVLLSVGVLVQSLRIDRRIRALRSTGLDEAVVRLEQATDHARDVLGELKVVLSSGAAVQAGELASARELRDELSVMVGIGNSVADRIVEASDRAKAIEATSAILKAPTEPVAPRVPLSAPREEPRPREEIVREPIARSEPGSRLDDPVWADIGRAADEAAARLRARAATMRADPERGGTVLDINSGRSAGRGSAVA